MGPQVGEVISPPPNIQVKLGEKIILTKDNLVIAAHVLYEYSREININGNISTTDESGSITLKLSTPQTYTVVTGKENAKTTITGTMTYTDTLKKGDKVILIPATNEQLYFLVDKAVVL